MPLPRLKFFLLLLFIIILSILSLYIINNIFYDKNSFLNGIEDYLFKLGNKNLKFYKKNYDLNKKIENEKYYILNFDDPISSDDFLNILYFIKSCNVKYLIIDVNFDNMLDILNNNKIKIFYNGNYNFFASVSIKNDKGINYRFKNYSKDYKLYKNFLHIKKTKFPFIFSNYNSDVYIKNIFSITPEKIGFITDKNIIFDNNNIDILCKFENKYLYSLPFIIYSFKNRWSINKLDHNYTNISHLFDRLYYDQKGRASFKHFLKPINNIEINNYKTWKTAVKARNEALKLLYDNKLLIIEDNSYESFLSENEMIDFLNNISDIKNKNNQEIFKQAKNFSSIWYGFESFEKEKIKNSCFFITQNGNNKWVNNFINQERIINNGTNLKRIPILVILLFSFFLLLVIFIIILKVKHPILFIIILLIIFNILNFLLYINIRYFFKIDIPFLSMSLSVIFIVSMSLVIRYFNDYFWLKEVKSIFKGSISNKYTRLIAKKWKNNKWNLEPIHKLCTFLQIDISPLIKSDITENNIELFSSVISEIETIIKKNKGVRNNFDSHQISCYFGNPDLGLNHADAALKVTKIINEKSFSITSSNEPLTIAIHSMNEWFRYIKKDNQKCYTYYGNSFYILQAMIRYAKEFNTEIIISENTFKLSSNLKNIRMLDRVRIKGIDDDIRLFEIIPEDKYQKNTELYDYFHAGLKLFEKQKWNEAGAYFRQCLKLNENDEPSKIYLKRCKEFLYVPPDENWDMIYEIS